jgi:hypothetical protein
MTRPKGEARYDKTRSGCKWHNDCFTCPFDDCIDEAKEIQGRIKSLKEKANAKS